MAARMVRSGSRVADIGTDHAYLPSALILDGTINSAIAADLRKGPLENAQATVSSYSVADKIELRLSDGLTAISPDEVDDIIIAGMGGILISEILEAAPWVKNNRYKLILQPQSHDEILRGWLWDNGFEILEEASCFDDGKAYVCMSAAYSGVTEEHSQAQLLFGGFIKADDDASRAVCERKLRRVSVRLDALMKSDPDNPEIAALQGIIDEVKE